MIAEVKFRQTLPITSQCQNSHRTFDHKFVLH